MTTNLSEMDYSKIKENIENKSLKIAVIGIGRIGLPTALCFAQAGFETIGVDINEKLVNPVFTIFGINYNILRIKGGMGGIAYSN